MPFSRITSTRNGLAALKYCLGNGKGHNGHANRNILISGIGVVESIPLYMQFQSDWQLASSRNKTQFRRIIYSASKNEFTPGDPEAAYKMMNMCREYISRNYAGHKAVIFLQADGKSKTNNPPLYHCHMLISNVNFITHKGIPSYKCNHKFVKRTIDQIVNEYTTIDYGKNRNTKDRFTQNERRMREENTNENNTNPNFIIKDYIREQIRIAQNRAYSISDFIEILDKLNIDCRCGKKTFTYTLRKLPDGVFADTKKFAYRDKRLGPDFSPDAINEFINQKYIEQEKKQSYIEKSLEKISKTQGGYFMTQKVSNNATKKMTASAKLQQMLHKKHIASTNNSSSSVPGTLKKTGPLTDFERLIDLRDKLDKEYTEKEFYHSEQIQQSL